MILDRRLLIAGLILAATGLTPEPRVWAADDRQLLTVPAPARARILGEMRHMLEQLQIILLALSESDLAAAATAARAAGMAAAVDAERPMQQVLPAEFVQFGLATHQQFDVIADRLAAAPAQDEILGDLATLMGNCVVCHASYRLEVKGP